MIGEQGVVKVLLKNGADPNIADCAGENPLSMSTKKCHNDVVKVLLGALLGANWSITWSKT